MTTDRPRSPFPPYTPAPTSDGPRKPLSPQEVNVCDCVARGWPYEKIAVQCQISVRTARVHVHNIAEKLPWGDDNVKPYQRVFLWLQHRNWLTERRAA